MGRYILSRLAYSLLTILGVMIITFLLFRVVAGDISAAWLGTKATAQQRADWRHRHGYDLPLLANVCDRLVVRDLTDGDQPFNVADRGGSSAAASLAMVLEGRTDQQGRMRQELLSGYIARLGPAGPVARLTGGRPLIAPPQPTTAPGDEAQAAQGEDSGESPDAPQATATPPAAGPAATSRPAPQMVLHLADGSRMAVDVSGIQTVGELLDRLNAHPTRVRASISYWRLGRFFDSQFFHHLWLSISFQSRSLDTNKTLVQTIRERAPYSLALTVPALAMDWALALVIASLVAYYRGAWIDHVGVFASVIMMCLPFLGVMMYGQWLMFHISPPHAYGIYHRLNLYVPVLILVVTGLGGSVRFYRTVILDETNRDYVRTARAKGVALPSILFIHVLRNCMLPILTNLVMAIPFLMMGSLLLESFFGIPGLGDLMITSINGRDEPVLNTLVFMTALIYTAGILVTDILYSVMDPRIRLR